MKVALVSFDFGEYCVSLAEGLSQEVQVQLHLPALMAQTYANSVASNLTISPFHKPRLRQPWPQLKSVRQLLRSIRNFKPDVLHLQHRHLWFNLALPLLRDIPLVVTLHDVIHHVGDRDGRKTPEWITNIGYKQASQLIVHGEQVKEQAVKSLGLPADQLTVIPHIALGEKPANTVVPEDPFMILFFGRIWAYKGLDYLIKAEPLITAQVPQAHIVIAGIGENFDRYQQLIRNPKNFTIINEYISDKDRAKLFQQAAIIVLPYIEASQSGVIPLAYTFEKPVVATSVGSLPEMVEHGHTGLLAPPKDVEALAEAIVQLLQNQNQRREMGIKGRQKLDRECSPTVVALQTLEVYARALAQIDNFTLLNNRVVPL